MYKEGKAKFLIVVAYAYILIPFIIFALGWIGLRYSIPMTIILMLCFWKVCKSDSIYMWVPAINHENIVKIICILCIIFIWVYFSGIGRCVFQNTDHGARNAIFEALVSYKWPIINYNITSENLAGYSATSLIYYIGFWMPAAVVGKIWGISAGYGFQVFWAFLGIVIFYYLVCTKLKKLLVWPLGVIIFFSGLDIVGEYLMGVNLFTMENDLHLEWWMSTYQYSSMTTQLFWVFNQAIPAWICTMLIYLQKDNKNLIFILACCMLPGTLPFVGLLLLTLYFAFSRKYEIKEKKAAGKLKEYTSAFIKDIVTLQNLIGGGIIGIVSFAYLIGNMSGGKIMQKSTVGYSMDNNLLKYFIFLILEAGIYFIILYKYHKKDRLFYFILMCLCIIPPIKVGNSSDFCMRASIPALVILMIFVIEALQKAYEEKDKFIFASLMVVLLLGSFTPWHEFARTVKNTVTSVNNGEKPYIQTTEENINNILNGSNFSGPIDDNFFFRYIVK